MTCTIFETIYATEPHYISVDTALQRIKTGKSRMRVDEIRNALDKDKANDLKKMLPSVCFSGRFEKRQDSHMLEHSGFIVLDFDNVEVSEKLAQLAQRDIVYAAWVSPGGQGCKALVRIADGKKHRLHFAALKEVFPDADNSGVNESRVCYESYDPHLHLNRDAKVFTRTVEHQRIQERHNIEGDGEVFKRLLKWITNKGGSFSKGERNTFIFRLASACCRFGIDEHSAGWLILNEFPTGNDFTQKEAATTVRSAYRSNRSKAGTAAFEREVLVDKTSRREVEINTEQFDPSEPAKDVIYGASVKEQALGIFQNGYEAVRGIGVKEIDELFRIKRGELTCLTGIGNYGKSTYLKWYLLMRVLLYGEKFAGFCPEDNPAEEYYHDFVEMLLGGNCTPFMANGEKNKDQPHVEIYSNAYDFVSKHIFYQYPKDNKPTPEYTRERFLELVFKEKIDGVYIDPWNQMSHNYSDRTDKYLEGVFGDYSRWAQANNLYLVVVAHPHKLKKETNGNYPCPDVFDLADGAMWNNKMDNILVYHRPYMQTNPQDRTCEFHSKKIRRQKTVGKRGFIIVEYARNSRRYEVNGRDPMGEVLRQRQLSFNVPVRDLQPLEQKSEQKPYNPFAGLQGYQQNTERVPDNFFND